MATRVLLILALTMLPCAASRAARSNAVRQSEPKPLDQLMKDLGSDDWLVRHEAAGQVGLLGEQAAPAVMKALLDGNPHLRRGACEAIMAIRRPSPGKTREQAAAKAATVKPAIKTLVKMLAEDPDFWVRAGAAEALQSFGKDARAEAGPDLARALAKAIIDKKEDLWVRREALSALGASGAEADLDVPTRVQIYTEAAQFMDIMFRGGSLKKLGELGEAAAPAVPVLMEFVEKYCTNGADARAGIYSAMALGEIGVPAEPALPLLRKLAKDGPQGLVVEYKAGGAGDMGKKEAAEAVAKIEAALNHTDKPAKTDMPAQKARKAKKAK